MTKERRLGRGLEALLGRTAESTEPSATGPVGIAPHTRVQPAARSEGELRVSIYEVDRNPFQPRTQFDADEIGALADSLKQHGLLQPIVVRRVGDRFQLIAGERRLRAAIKAGWSDVPARIREVDDRALAEMAIVENMQRKDLGPLEKAASFRDYLARYGCTQEELAGRLKIDRSTVANLIRLLELPEEVQDALRRGAITQGHARALLPLGDEHEQVAFCARIQRDGLSVRNTEAIVSDHIQQIDAEPLTVISADGRSSSRRAARPRSENLSALEQEFRAALGAKVDVRQTAKGRGRVVIHFKSHAEFDRLRETICGPAPGSLRSDAG